MVDSKLVQPWLLREGLARCRADSLCGREWWPGLVRGVRCWCVAVRCAAAVKMEAARMEDRCVEARRNCGEDGCDGGTSRWLL